MPLTAVRALAALFLCLLASFAQGQAPADAELARAGTAFLDYLDAHGAVGYIESGGVRTVGGDDLPTWRDRRSSLLATLNARLEAAAAVPALSDADRDALAAMRRTMAEQSEDGTTAGERAHGCADAQDPDLDGPGLRAALVSCYVEYGNRLAYAGGTIDRGTALQLLHVTDDPARRRELFESFRPLWTALNGSNEPTSPYRRMIALTAAQARVSGSEVDAAAKAIGVTTVEVERWLVQILEAWRDANPSTPVEPWDFRYVNGAANRQLQARIPATLLLPVNRRFYAELGADLGQLGVAFDLDARADKSPLAYTDFVARGREVNGRWQRPRARVLGTYPEGGLFSLNELVHENGHAVHVSAINTPPAYMDWPDTLFTEAFADVPSWSVHEPAWQRRYLGTAVDEAVSMRALFANVMLDVAWSLFELRMLRDPGTDPNALWTSITHDYLRVVPHPEVPWWAMRVQLAGNPGYMVNYGLGAVLTAEIRAATGAAIGAFDAGNPRWYAWSSEQLLRYGSARDTRRLLQDLLGRPLSVAALLEQVRRCGAQDR